MQRLLRYLTSEVMESTHKRIAVSEPILLAFTTFEFGTRPIEMNSESNKTIPICQMK